MLVYFWENRFTTNEYLLIVVFLVKRWKLMMTNQNQKAVSYVDSCILCECCWKTDNAPVPINFYTHRQRPNIFIEVKS